MGRDPRRCGDPTQDLHPKEEKEFQGSVGGAERPPLGGAGGLPPAPPKCFRAPASYLTLYDVVEHQRKNVYYFQFLDASFLEL